MQKKWAIVSVCVLLLVVLCSVFFPRLYREWTRRSLLRAVENNDIVAVKRHLRRGGTAYLNLFGDSTNFDLILLACANGNLQIVKALSEEGVNLTYSTVDGKTPLLVASSSGNVDLVRFLLQAGNDPNAKDSNGWTPLARAMFSATRGSIDVARELIMAGAHVNVTNGRPPLALAVSLGKPELIKLLIERGADTNASDPVTGRAALLSLEQNRKATAEFISNYVGRSKNSN